MGAPGRGGFARERAAEGGPVERGDSWKGRTWEGQVLRHPRRQPLLEGMQGPGHRGLDAGHGQCHKTPQDTGRGATGRPWTVDRRLTSRTSQEAQPGGKGGPGLPHQAPASCSPGNAPFAPAPQPAGHCPQALLPQDGWAHRAPGRERPPVPGWACSRHWASGLSLTLRGGTGGPAHSLPQRRCAAPSCACGRSPNYPESCQEIKDMPTCFETSV